MYIYQIYFKINLRKIAYYDNKIKKWNKILNPTDRP